jgi:hypothetical protein|tara:strand:+ start:4669 stop:5256 length:588 start_codon:yes stop_codon:yes gene_type:complete
LSFVSGVGNVARGKGGFALERFGSFLEDDATLVESRREGNGTDAAEDGESSSSESKSGDPDRDLASVFFGRSVSFNATTGAGVRNIGVGGNALVVSSGEPPGGTNTGPPRRGAVTAPCGVLSANFFPLDSPAPVPPVPFRCFITAYDDASAEARADAGETAVGDGGGFAGGTAPNSLEAPAVTGGGGRGTPARRP